METARRFVGSAPTRFAAYIALQCALMRRFIARGGTPEEFCSRLAPVFHRRYAPLLLDGDAGAALVHFDVCTTVRLRRAA
jgi:hypothetical protein